MADFSTGRVVKTYLSHTAIDNKVRTVDEAALVAREEEYCLSLLNSFSETPGREVNLATVTLSCIVSEPILEKRCTASATRSDRKSRGGAEVMHLLERRGTQGVEAESLSCVNDCQLASDG